MECIVDMILCTGNPKDPTVASAVKKIFPQAEFASRNTGYDLRFWNPGSEDYFKNQIANYNICLFQRSQFHKVFARSTIGSLGSRW